MKRKTEPLIDSRTVEKLREQIKKLAASYTPEWCFDTVDPDIGSTLAMIYANQYSGNINRLNRAPEKYRTEFVNLLGLSLKPAYPASGVVVAEPVRSAAAGIPLPHGTRLIADSEEESSESPIIFETVSDIYVTGARIRDIFSVSGSFGKIIPLQNGPEAVPLIDEERQPEIISEADIEAEQELAPISLFDYSDDGIQQHALLMYHHNVFDALPDSEILIRLKTDYPSALERFVDPDSFEWCYYNGTTLAPFKVSLRDDGCISLTRSGESVETPLGHIICLRAKQPIFERIDLGGIAFSSSCEDTNADFVCADGLDVDTASFMPFGDEASLFDECYIGCESLFHQKGSRITMSFHLDLREKMVMLTAQQEEEELKIIKRKPRESFVQMAFTSPQQVSLEYFNGIGWRRLMCDEDWSSVFDGTHSGNVDISFICPDDWQPASVGGYNSRCIRLRIVRADNCYLRPCKHTMPIISGLHLAYTYEDCWSAPQQLFSVNGTKKTDITKKLLEKESFTAFAPIDCTNNSLYLGFDSAIEGAPVSILFDIEQNIRFESFPIAFEYSTLSGFKPLRVIDNTHNMSGSGTVIFMPPSDFAETEVEGVRRRWLRLVDERRASDDPKCYHAVIRSILLNAVEIRNIEYRDEQSFYIDFASPNMSFPLSAENILSADVFVNEKNSLSPTEMKRLMAQQPQDIRAEYDFLGEIQNFFVRWSEVESFDLSHSGDRHYIIDRMNNQIIFGDGVHVRIPTAQNAAAFTVKCRCCRGEEANLPAGAINTPFESILYLNSIENPIATYAGSSIEKPESAHERGANMISGRGRLVSIYDYEREILAFSDAVEQVRCVAGVTPEGKPLPCALTIALLMSDYRNGNYSFRSIKERLHSHLLTRSEMTADSESLILTEPLFVEITLDIWAVARDAQRSFDIQNAILDSVEDFLDPLGSHGWNIGELPDETQIRMMLHSVEGVGHISRYVITARYTDHEGSHETTLDRLPQNPFVIPINGSHRIYMELPGSR